MLSEGQDDTWRTRGRTLQGIQFKEAAVKTEDNNKASVYILYIQCGRDNRICNMKDNGMDKYIT
jgi:hypothetical protein